MKANRNPVTMLAAGMIGLALLATGAPAHAQGRDVQVLINRVNRLQTELSTLQSHVYRGAPPPTPAAPAAEGAVPGAPAVAATTDPRALARIDSRLSQLETALRELTGRVERIGHDLRQAESRIDRLVGDVDVRLSALEQGGATPPAGDPADGERPATPPQAAAATPPPIGARPGEPAAPGLGAPPRVLGAVPQEDVDRLRAGARPAPAGGEGEPQQAALPGATPEQQYDHAIGLMVREQDFAAAETALRAFLEEHGDHRLASNAQYWLGETHYVRNEFEQAAYAFAEGFQKYPESDKAPDNLLKLGMSLGELGRPREACTAFQRLVDAYPDMSQTISRRVAMERRRHECR